MPGILDALSKLIGGATAQEAQKIVYRPKTPLENQKVSVGKRPGTHGHTFEQVMELRGKGKTCELCAGGGKALLGEKMEEVECPICKGTGHSAVEIPKVGGPLKTVHRIKSIGSTNEIMAKTITPPAAKEVQQALREASAMPMPVAHPIPGLVTESGGIYPRSLPEPAKPFSLSLKPDKPENPVEGDITVDPATGKLEMFTKGRWELVGREAPAATAAAASIKRRSRERVRVETLEGEAEHVIPRKTAPSPREKETMRDIAAKRKEESDW